ncbi:MAG: hypothetical protein JSS49_27245 [Planctomycetes bacterium]|nr:hypothetical protein [Planctomycetota bacterium]
MPTFTLRSNRFSLRALVLAFVITGPVFAESPEEVFRGTATEFRLDLLAPVDQFQLQVDEWKGAVQLLNQAYDYIMTTKGAPREIAARNYNRDRSIAVAHAANAETTIRSLNPMLDRARDYLADPRTSRYRTLPEYRLLRDVLERGYAAIKETRQIPDTDPLPDPLPAPVFMAGVASVWYPDELDDDVTYTMEVEVQSNCKYREMQLSVEARVVKGKIEFDKSEPLVKQVNLSPDAPSAKLTWKFQNKGDGDVRIGAVVTKATPIGQSATQQVPDPLAKVYANRILSTGRAVWEAGGSQSLFIERLPNPLDEDRIARQRDLLKPLDVNEFLKLDEDQAMKSLRDRLDAAVEEASRQAREEVGTAIRGLREYGLLGAHEDVLIRQRKDPYTAAAVDSAVKLAADHEIQRIHEARAESLKHSAAWYAGRAELADLKKNVETVIARGEEEYQTERMAAQQRAFQEVQSIYGDLGRRGLTHDIHSLADWDERERTDPVFRHANEQSHRIADRLAMEVRDSRNRSYAKMLDELRQLLATRDQRQPPK